MANEIKTPAEAYIAAANLPSGAIAAEDWLPTATRTQAVAGALATYGRLFPREVAEATTGDGTTYLDLSTLTTWDENASGVLFVEYPYSSDELGENRLHTDAWEVLSHPTNGKVLRFLEDTPAATEAVLVGLTTVYAEGDVPSHHIDAVAKLAAANMALALASRTASHKEATVGGSWNAAGARQAYAETARNLRADAMKDLGVGTGGAGGEGGGSDVAPADGIQPIDRDLLTTHGYGRLARPRRRIY